MRGMLGFRSETRWLLYVRTHCRHMFPFAPKDPRCNRRLRAALPQIKREMLGE
ncbi:hypothetical protein AB0A98_06545 [Streptomyces chrestomyceticus]|uniref:hypothetical protein n=1 Tax=Streptomyces chrestomyceticus TaxID=68185 RepID=UPI0033F2C415